MALDDKAAPAAVAPAVTETGPVRKKPGRLRKWRRRKPVKKATIWLHRWVSLVLGLVLLLVTTTGAIVVYTPEWTKWTNGKAFDVEPTVQADRIGVGAAVDAVTKQDPSFDPGSVNVYDNLYEVFSSDQEAHPGFYGVDPGTGAITGHVHPDRGFMAFMNQIHECFFTCDSYPGYVSWFAEDVPQMGIGWLADVTWATVFLGGFGLVLLFLGVSGVWLWYPTIKKWKHGFRLRLDKGRYARDYDIHQLVGMAAVPFLLMWGLTGASFELPFVSTVWYQLTGGQTEAEQNEPADLTSAEVAEGTQDIGLAQAAAAAQRVAGEGNDLDYASLPAKDDATATYFFYFDHGMDQYEYGAYPGNYGVAVDRHDATRTQVDDLSAAPTLSNKLLDTWGGNLFHYGIAVNGWWRLIWFLFGLTPLVLAVTGVSTWLAKRSVRKRRKEAAAERAKLAAEKAGATDVAALPAT